MSKRKLVVHNGVNYELEMDPAVGEYGIANVLIHRPDICGPHSYWHPWCGLIDETGMDDATEMHMSRECALFWASKVEQ